MTRDKRKIKFTKPVVSNKEGMQLSTPESVAKYIAKRLKTDIIADLGCGIGGQVIFFAKKCNKVYAIDKNPVKLRFAKKNCELYNVNNVEFILGDVLSKSTREKISDADIIFSDPARPLSERERTLESLEPSIIEILKLYSTITEKFAFHIPPQMPPSRINLDCEREYLSFNNQLNRMTLYFNALKRCERSAVILPDELQLCSSNASQIKTSPLQEYVYEPEPSIAKGQLLNELCQIFANKSDEIFFYKGDTKRTLLTSFKLLDSLFFKDRYRVLGKVEGDILRIKNILKSEKAKNVILRFDIEPEKYWEVRKMLEDGLNGSNTFHVFGFGKKFIVCEKIKK